MQHEQERRASTALGDTVTTKAGRDIDGIVLQESGESVTIRVGYATMTLPRAAVASIRRRRY